MHNWNTSEYSHEEESPENMYEEFLTEGEVEIFNTFLPYGEYGIHTIEEIKILEISSEEILFRG